LEPSGAKNILILSPIFPPEEGSVAQVIVTDSDASTAGTVPQVK